MWWEWVCQYLYGLSINAPKSGLHVEGTLIVYYHLNKENGIKNIYVKLFILCVWHLIRFVLKLVDSGYRFVPGKLIGETCIIKRSLLLEECLGTYVSYSIFKEFMSFVLNFWI